RQRLFSQTAVVSDQDKKSVIDKLKKNRYNIVETDGSVLAEKNRFSRWGPYVNHIGLIIILIAAILRTTPLFFLDDYVWVREGEQKVIPGTDGEYYIENKQFLLELYDKDDERFKDAMEKTGEQVHKNYQTDVIIYKDKEANIVGADPELEKITESSIRMNQPLKFGGLSGYTLYQSGFQENEFSNMTFKVYETADVEQSSLGEVTIDLTSPEKFYELDSGMKVEVSQYYPDYELQDGEPRSISKFPRNPAFVFTIYPLESKDSEISFVGIGKNIDATGKNKYKLGITNFENHYVSGIT